MICNKCVRSINVKKRKKNVIIISLPPSNHLLGCSFSIHPSSKALSLTNIQFRLHRFIITEAKTRSAADPAAKAEKRLEPIG